MKTRIVFLNLSIAKCTTEKLGYISDNTTSTTFSAAEKQLSQKDGWCVGM